MSALPHDGSIPAPAETGWQACRGLTLTEAEELLDHLENGGVASREMSIEDDGVCVRWRTEWPRLMAE